MGVPCRVVYTWHFITSFWHLGEPPWWRSKVGKTAAALVLVLVVETQCRVNVNVHLNIPNSGSGSATGHIEGACAAVIKEEENGKTIAVVGGHVALLNGTRRTIFENMTTIFQCDNLKEEPVCKQLPNGPTLKTRHFNSNCGVIKAENGRKILLAMKDKTAEESKVETLDLDDSSAQWEILKGVNIETNISFNQWNSFVSSQDPRKGYYFPPDRSDIFNIHEYYEVTCKSAKECDFKKEYLGEFRPGSEFTIISLPTNHGLKCE